MCYYFFRVHAVVYTSGAGKIISMDIADPLELLGQELLLPFEQARGDYFHQGYKPLLTLALLLGQVLD
jgi:hypothetical protein